MTVDESATVHQHPSHVKPLKSPQTLDFHSHFLSGAVACGSDFKTCNRLIGAKTTSGRLQPKWGFED